MALLSVRAAQRRIGELFPPGGVEDVRLDQCIGRVLFRDIRAPNLPFFDHSSVDGFAIIASDVTRTRSSPPRALRVVADITAGKTTTVRLRSGQAARIMTGAQIPAGADAVIMLEDTDLEQQGPDAPLPAWVTALRRVHTGSNIRRRGSDVRKGQVVLRRGHRLRPQDIGMLAMLGSARVHVFRRPRVALLSSGNELLPVHAPLQPGKIRDTNTYTLSALLTDAGCEVISLGIAKDSRPAIKAHFDRAIEARAELILSSAGVSVGAFDLVRDVVKESGHLEFWRVNVRPGKPLAVGTFRGRPFIGLPGNPVSAFVGFELFVRPALERAQGMRATSRRVIAATLGQSIDSDGRESYLRARVRRVGGEYVAKLTGHQGSGNLLSMVHADALLIIPAGVKSLAVGAPVDAWLL